MDAWVYLFSKFSHEALLFEALALFLGLFGYAIFYLIRKRKYGVAGKDVPSNIIKIYLAQLMGDAEEIRNQLFGLLGKHEASALRAGMQFQTDPFEGMRDTTGTGAVAAGAAIPAPTTSAAADPRLNEKLKELERRLAEQAGALDSVLNDKMKLEEELANARARATSSTNNEAKESDGPDRTAPMAERLRQLEAQLAEYAIIEDDLANLKRLQKENKTLKEQLNNAGAGAPAATAAANAAAAASSAAKAAPTAAAEKPSAAAAAPTMPDLSDSNHPADFESLVDVVEKNLADPNKSANVDSSTEATAPEFNLEAGSASEQKSDEKSEEQLQADFEKMLNS